MSRSFILFSTARPLELVDALSPSFDGDVEVREEDGHYNIRALWKDGAFLISHTEEAKDETYAIGLEDYQDSLLYLEESENERFQKMEIRLYHCQIQCEIEPVNRFFLSIDDYALMIDFPILITDTELKPMLEADIGLDWYRWHQTRLSDPAVKAKYYSDP
ncbi:hypothetical protein [Inquilinus limosus]|uniref:hypothetical protein n=1 Tax=Inquilinus limosus TaxID=171674 RepID=UPI0004792DB8|nr:hypothetical protein [Inquilinus limosus]